MTESIASKEHLQDLVNSFDDIPEIMKKVNGNLADSPQRFKVLVPNHSFGAASVLRGNLTVDVNNPSNSSQAARMADQAMKVLEQLSKISDTSANKRVKRRSVKETSNIARNKLRNLQEAGVDLKNFFSKFDACRTGKMTYDDFNRSLVQVSSGIGKEEAAELASKLDSKKIGGIEYSNILAALQEIERRNEESAVLSEKELATIEQFDVASPRVQPNTAFKNVRLTKSLLDEPVKDRPSSSSSSVISVEDNRSSQQSSHGVATSLVDGVGNVHEFVGYMDLNPQLPPKPKPPPLPEKDTLSMRLDGRRLYPQNEGTVLSAHHSRNPPYHIEKPIDMVKALQRRTKELKEKYPLQFTHGDLSVTDDGIRTGRSNTVSRTRSRSAPATPRGSLRHALIKTINDDGSAERTHQQEESRKAQILGAKLKENPFFRGHSTEHKSRQQQLDEKRNRTLENAVAHHFNGNTGRLRNLLQSQDPTKSGFVNRAEFRRAMQKASIHVSDRDLDVVFNAIATDKTSHNNDITFSGGKGLDIEKFVDRIYLRSAAPSFAHIQQHSDASQLLPRFGAENKFGNHARRLHEVRIMKKILQGMSKLNNPHEVYRSLDNNHNGWLRKEQMKEAIHFLGANISQEEFKVLTEGMRTDSNGKIEIAAFERRLHDEVASFDQSSSKTLREQIQNSKGYSRTYRSTQDFFGNVDAKHTEYEPICVKSAKKSLPSKHWSKLRQSFQQNPRAVLGAFTNARSLSEVSGDDNRGRLNVHKQPKAAEASLRPLSLRELRRNLTYVGIDFGDADSQKLEELLDREAANQPNTESKNDGTAERKVTINHFCEVMGIPMGRTPNDEIVLLERFATQDDGGIFASARNSLSAQPTISSSYYLDDGSNVTGQRRRRSSSFSTTAHPPTEPSRFWEMQHGSDMVFPSPMPSYREPWPHQSGHGSQKKLTPEQSAIADALASAAKDGAVGNELYGAAARRGLIKVSPAPRSLSSHIQSGLSRTSTVDSALLPPFATDHETAVTTVVLPRRTLMSPSKIDRKRSSSAPPRSSCMSRGGGMLSSGSSVRTVFNNSEALASLIQQDDNTESHHQHFETSDSKSETESVALMDRRKRAAQKVAEASASSNSLARFFSARDLNDLDIFEMDRGSSGSTASRGGDKNMHHTFKRTMNEKNARSNTFATPNGSVSASAPFATEG